MLNNQETQRGFISSTEVIEWAARLSISATATTLSRYQKEGLMLPPNRDILKAGQGRPANYHPLCVSELAAATWLYKGFFPSINKSKKKIMTIARFSTEDIFFARAKFYLSGTAEELVSQNKLPDLELLEYHMEKSRGKVSVVAYKQFLEKKVNLLENSMKKSIMEDNNLFISNHKEMPEYYLDLLDDSNGSFLSSASSLETLCQREYAVSAYKILFLRAFYALRSHLLR